MKYLLIIIFLTSCTTYHITIQEKPIEPKCEQYSLYHYTRIHYTKPSRFTPIFKQADSLVSGYSPEIKN